MHARWGTATAVGHLRSNNEDSLLARDGLFIVADGMGGAHGGEVASRVAVESLDRAVTAERPTTADLMTAIREANQAVFEQAAADPALSGMGTTLCALALVSEDNAERADDRTDTSTHENTNGPVEEVAVANVGDSRAYLFRNDDLTPITEDHNVVGQLVREGRLTPEEARLHPHRNRLTRVLGVDADVEVDCFPVIPYKGDRYLLCSDGLFGEVTDDHIAGALRQLTDPSTCAHELVRLANEEGGRDNTTVVVVDIVDDEHLAQVASSALAVKGSYANASQETGVHQLDDDADKSAKPTETRSRRDETQSDSLSPPLPAQRRLTWRVLLFLLVLLVMLTAVTASVWWQARNTYFVAFRGAEVAIFRGRPGGVLWFDPTFEESTTIHRKQVPSAHLADLNAGKPFSSPDEADRYVQNLRAQITSRRDTDGAKSTTTSSAPGKRAVP